MHAEIPIDQYLGKIVFFNVIFWDKKCRTSERDALRFLRWNFLRFYGLFVVSVPLIVPINSKNAKDQI